MQLKIKSDTPEDKQKLMAIGLIAVIVIAAGVFIYTNFLSGSGSQPADISAQAPVAGGQPGPSVSGPPGPIQPTAPGPTSGTSPQPGPGAAPGAAGAPSPAPSAPNAAPTNPAPSAAPAPAPSAPAPSKPGAPGAAKTITVFGSVTVTYPSGWGIGMGSSGPAAVLTDGKARFEIHAPDPKAATAKAIADSALASFAKGGKVTAQGASKIAGYDAYQYSIGGSTRIVGIDAPTRVVIVERAGSMAAYKATFTKMESDLKFR